MREIFIGPKGYTGGITGNYHGTHNYGVNYYINSELSTFGFITGGGVNSKASITVEEMQSTKFVDNFNSYVDTYNSNTENTVTLKRWKYNAGNYPTFE